jgi:hypothetical protein
MKLKNKVISTIFSIVASSFLLIGVPTQANAAPCSAEDPCMNYAVVDPSGSVINVIVCQPSFCSGMVDSNGNRYIPQQAANPVTHNYEGTNAEISRPEQNKIVTVSNDGIYTVTQNGAVTKTFSAPEVIVTKNDNSTVVTTTSESASFGTTESVITDTGTAKITNPDSVKITVNEQVNSEVSTPTSNITNLTNTVETLYIPEKQTQKQFVVTVNNSLNTIMKSKIDRLTKLLQDWFM